MHCNICHSGSVKVLFSKTGKEGKTYTILQCRNCRVVQTYPQPEHTEWLYGETYFRKRTDRGYDNYHAESTKEELLRVWKLNLEDLGFFRLEKELFSGIEKPRMLEIGSAAGHFLDYMQKRNWDVEGVEISESMVDFSRSHYKVKVHHADFLEWQAHRNEEYHAVFLWATLEHLKDPVKAFHKIYHLLKPGGILILTTCRWGIIPYILQSRWRFMNVPEHLFFFHEKSLSSLLAPLGFKKYKHITYGSGFTRKPGAGVVYRTLKYISDALVKKWNTGDMLAILFLKS